GSRASSRLPLLGLLDDAVGRTSDQLLQMVELGAERAHALCHRADLDDHVGDLGFRHQGGDLVPARPALARVVAQELAASSRDQALDARGRVAGRRHRHLEDGLEQHRLALGQAFGERNAGRHLERHFRAVDRVVLAVIERDLEVDHRLAERSLPEILAQALLARGAEVAWHHAAPDLVDEAETRAARQRLDLDLDVTDLAVTAGLSLVARVLMGAGLDRLAVGYPGRRRLDGDVVAAGQL